MILDLDDGKPEESSKADKLENARENYCIMPIVEPIVIDSNDDDSCDMYLE